METVRFQYIRARLLEEMGRPDQALAGYRAADLSHAGERLAGRFDAAIERLTGAPSPDALARDPWRRHEHHLLTREPGDDGFEQAIAAIREHAGPMLEIGDPTLGGRFPPPRWRPRWRRSPAGAGNPAAAPTSGSMRAQSCVSFGSYAGCCGT